MQSGQLYVHNEYLLDWLRFGYPGLIAIVIPVAAGVVLAVRRLRTQRLNAVQSAAAYLLLIAPVAAMSAAFFDTSRWPAILGLAVGILSTPIAADSVTLRPSMRSSIDASANLMNGSRTSGNSIYRRGSSGIQHLPASAGE